MAEQRNFRSAYLEKVGIKGVEEKKSLEILLKEQPLDVVKLIQFCLRFPVPAVYRTFLWKVLLGVLPPHQCTHEFVTRQRHEQYSDLQEALEAMGRINDSTPLPEVHLRMFLLEEGVLPFQEHKMLTDPANERFVAIATTMLEVAEDQEVDAYWLTTRFCRLQDKFKDFLPVMVEKTEQYLKKEDTEGKFYTHLSKLRAFKQLPLTKWFMCCYAGVLPGGSFERIWDKVIGGSATILIHVAVAILLTFKRPIRVMDNMDDILKILSHISPDSGDIIVSKTIELWQKHGSLLMPVAVKGESPSLIDRAPS